MMWVWDNPVDVMQALRRTSQWKGFALPSRPGWFDNPTGALLPHLRRYVRLPGLQSAEIDQTEASVA